MEINEIHRHVINRPIGDVTVWMLYIIIYLNSPHLSWIEMIRVSARDTFGVILKEIPRAETDLP